MESPRSVILVGLDMSTAATVDLIARVNAQLKDYQVVVLDSLTTATEQIKGITPNLAIFDDLDLPEPTAFELESTGKKKAQWKRETKGRRR